MLLVLANDVLGAGGVVGEAGSCMIKIGFYTAHFTVYQPQANPVDEYCEDLPAVAKTVFVLDYLHNSLKDVAVDFRIIKDINGLGQFARWENIALIENIEAQTVFYQTVGPQKLEQLTFEYAFVDPGAYIGIVSAGHPSKEIVYHAVFPFVVGGTGLNYWHALLAIVVLLQLQFMYSRGLLWFPDLKNKFQEKFHRSFRGKYRGTLDE